MIPTPLGNGPPMQKVTLVSGPPGCGKTAWALQAFQAHTGPCNYLRIAGKGSEQLQQGEDGGINRAWLTDQVPALLPASNPEKTSEISTDETLTVVEVQQFQQPQTEDLDGYGTQVTSLLEEHGLKPTRFLHFGRDQELPQQDTLAFTHLESWNKSLTQCVWDPNSLSSFWFELVNGAYGDVYRAKGLMNLPDGRSFFCNWMVSQQESQFLPLNCITTQHGRPERCSGLVVQGRALNPLGIQSTIDDCLLTDDVLELQQQQHRNQPNNPQHT